jgi:hypothetical protein
VAKAKKKSTRVLWSASDLKTLRALSKTDTTRTAAKKLGRTAGAIQQKASTEGISFFKKAKRKAR